ncbi:YveK family protein [Streptococcus suis]|uniref:YveK family protein n=1 Tax=Streptococcus suis TaxID=1307 RepID=UPI0004289BAA|nr:Wzz/FepE/Etk N-terminal domain-containing protein [Streptococcus suis]
MEEIKNEQIDLMNVVRFLRTHLFKIIIFGLTGAVIMFGYALFMVTPKYSSTTQLLVTRNETIEQQSYQNETRTNLEMIPTYKEILMSEPVLDEVVKEVGGQVSVGRLKSNLTFNHPDEKSQTFTLSLKWDSPAEAQRILTVITEKFTQVLQTIYGDNISKVVVLSKASYSAGKTEPNLKKYALIGAVIGVVLTLAQALYMMLADNTVTNTEFIESMNLVVLGELYEMSPEEQQKSRLGRQDSRRW